MIDWEHNDELFFNELTTGHRWAEYVAEKLRHRKIPCHVKPVDFRKSLDDRDRFENEQDVILESVRGCLEVKSRRLRFGSEPVTYPYSTAFVDTVSGWNKKSPRPLAVVLVSQLTKNMLVVPVSTQDRWTTSRSLDRVRNIQETWYTVKKTDLRSFDDLIDWLSVRQG